MSIDPLDQDYNPRIGVPDVTGLFARWQQSAADARAQLAAEEVRGHVPGEVGIADARKSVA